jgi:hypothetical protein
MDLNDRAPEGGPTTFAKNTRFSVTKPYANAAAGTSARQTFIINSYARTTFRVSVNALSVTGTETVSAEITRKRRRIHCSPRATVGGTRSGSAEERIICKLIVRDGKHRAHTGIVLNASTVN